jgi:purine-cytosine permease-like protein
MLRLISYCITPVLAILLRKEESMLTFALLPILFAVLYNRSLIHIALALILGFTMAFVEYVCIQYGMWKYLQARSTIPTWLPILWSIVAVFMYDVFCRFL